MTSTLDVGQCFHHEVADRGGKRESAIELARSQLGHLRHTAICGTRLTFLSALSKGKAQQSLAHLVLGRDLAHSRCSFGAFVCVCALALYLEQFGFRREEAINLKF